MPSSQTGYAAAKLINQDTNDFVEFQFRPEKYTFAKDITWSSGNQDTAARRNMLEPSFGGGQPISMTLDLLFDSYEDTSEKDVRKKTQKLWDMAMITASRKDSSTGQGSPPLVS